MKLEGWITVENDGEEPTSWMADQNIEDLKSNMEEFQWIDWSDPVRCTITIPDSKEAPND